MMLFFVLGEADSDTLIKYCYSQYRNFLSAFISDLPKTVEVIRSEKDKPRLDCEGVFFNLSHSHGVTMLGISDSEIGVDIEKIRPVNLENFYFVGADTEEEFFEKWTERESYLKYTGRGLSGLKMEIPSSAHFEHFEPYEGYHACVCAETQNVIAYELSPEAFKGENK